MISGTWKTCIISRINVVQDEKHRTVWIGQPTYTENLLRKYDMQNCKPVGTPVDAGSKLVKATEDDHCIDQHLYQSGLGSLMYPSVSYGPDITYMQ